MCLMGNRRYDPHEALVMTARETPELWRLMVGIGVVVVVTFVLNGMFTSLLFQIMPAEWSVGLLEGTTPGQLLVVLTSFVFVIIGVAAAVHQLHKRSLVSLIGPLGTAFVQFRTVFVHLCLLLVVLLILPPYGMDEPLQRNLSPGRWLMLLPLSLIALLIQTASEEILFRGYIQQSLAARFKSPLVWIGLPSALFALGHYAPGFGGENTWLIVLWAGLFGAFAADLTARSGTLGPAIALHLFNNIIAILFIAPPDAMNGLSLYISPYPMDQTEAIRGWLMVDFLMMVVCWLVARLALRR